MTHKYEMIRWANLPDGTEVFCKIPNGFFWVKLSDPSWYPRNIYIVDDEFAEIRKAYIDGAKIQAKTLWGNNCPASFNREWYDYDCEDTNIINGNHNGTTQIYRLKPKVMATWQYICQDNEGNFKMTRARYPSIVEAQKARQEGSKWTVLEPYGRSYEMCEWERR